MYARKNNLENHSREALDNEGATNWQGVVYLKKTNMICFENNSWH